MIKKKNHYVTGPELATAIRNSKATYCAFLHPYTIEFDEVITDLADITPELIAGAKVKRANREQMRLRKEARAAGLTPKSPSWAATTRTPDDYQDSEMSFRLATSEHIPDELARNRKGGIHYDINFPAFKHYARMDDGEIVEVCRSHWQGSISNGYFSQDHGSLTKRLGHYIKLIVDRYGTRGNVRGYSYIEDLKSEAMMQLVRKALKFDETKGINTFAYYSRVIENAFNKGFGIEKAHQVLRDTIMEENGQTASHAYQLRDFDQRTGLMKR